MVKWQLFRRAMSWSAMYWELEAGDWVAADARLLASASLECVEAALTGESETVAKSPAELPPNDVQLGDRTNMVFAGTTVASGTGSAAVVATGMRTEIGQIAEMIKRSGYEFKHTASA